MKNVRATLKSNIKNEDINLIESRKATAEQVKDMKDAYKHLTDIFDDYSFDDVEEYYIKKITTALDDAIYYIEDGTMPNWWKEKYGNKTESRKRPVVRRINERNKCESLQLKSLNESWLKDFSKLNKWEQSKVRDELLKSNVDIENEDFEEVHFRNNRDPELKRYLNNGFLVFKFNDRTIAVTKYGNFVVDPYISDLGYKNASKLPMRDLLDYATEIYALIPSKQQDIKDLRQQRKDAKAGSVDRYYDQKGIIGGDSRYRDRNYNKKYDKSGYSINPDKYKNMLAEMGIGNVYNILKDAKDVYVQLANKIYDVDLNADRDKYFSNNYTSIINNLLSDFRQLENYYDSYLNEKISYSNHPEYGNYSFDDYSFYKPRVMELIKDIRETVKQAKRYL